jgi:hypothetical protein
MRRYPLPKPKPPNPRYPRKRSRWENATANGATERSMNR